MGDEIFDQCRREAIRLEAVEAVVRQNLFDRTLQGDILHRQSDESPTRQRPTGQPSNVPVAIVAADPGIQSVDVIGRTFQILEEPPFREMKQTADLTRTVVPTRLGQNAYNFSRNAHSLGRNGECRYGTIGQADQFMARIH